jgi:hypothetical protein
MAPTITTAVEHFKGDVEASKVSLQRPLARRISPSLSQILDRVQTRSKMHNAITPLPRGSRFLGLKNKLPGFIKHVSVQGPVLAVR